MNPEHISYTQYAMFLRCPKQYEYRYVYGIKEPPASGLLLGKATHRALEYAFREHIEEGEAPGLEFVREATAAAVDEQFTDIPPSEVVWEDGDSKDTLKPAAIGLVEAYDGVRKSLVPTAAEREFALDIGTGPNLVGVVDVETTDALVDIKTGKRKKAENAADLSEQLTVYQAGRESAVETLELHVLVRAKTPTIQVLKSRPRSPEQIQETIENIAIVARAIAAGNFPRVPEDAIASPCSWCGYYERCRGKKRVE